MKDIFGVAIAVGDEVVFVHKIGCCRRVHLRAKVAALLPGQRRPPGPKGQAILGPDKLRVEILPSGLSEAMQASVPPVLEVLARSVMRRATA